MMCDDTLKCTISGEHIKFKKSSEISTLENSVDHIKYCNKFFQGFNVDHIDFQVPRLSWIN